MLLQLYAEAAIGSNWLAAVASFFAIAHGCHQRVSPSDPVLLQPARKLATVEFRCTCTDYLGKLHMVGSKRKELGLEKCTGNRIELFPHMGLLVNYYPI